jgi:leucyl aminopeptidase
MKINSTQTPLLEWSGDAIALGFFETDEILTLKGEMIQLNDRLSGTIEELIAETECKGKSCCTCVTRVGGNNPIRKIIIVGLGKQEDFNLDTLRKIGANLARIAKKEKIKTLGLSLPFVENNQMESAQAIAEGLILALHQDNRFKSEPEKNDLKLEIVELIGFCAIEKAIIQAQQICSGVILARELVNAPPNVVTSLTMAQTAQELAKDYGLTLEILEREDCEKLGMGSFLGVAKGFRFTT